METDFLALLGQTPEMTFLDYLSRASSITFLILVIIGAYRGWWITPREHNDLKTRHEKLKERYEHALDDADAWKETALRAGAAAKTSTTIAEAAVQRAARGS